jgi:hypothetical protein
MTQSGLLTADEAAKVLRIGRRTFVGHVVRGDIAYIAVGLGFKWIRERSDPEGIAPFGSGRAVECAPEPTPRHRQG